MFCCIHDIAMTVLQMHHNVFATLIGILWTPSKDGYLTPRVQIEPVKLGGVTINFATGKNARFIESNKGGWLISQTNKNISELENLIKNILLNPNKLVKASNEIKKLSNKLMKLRDNKTPAEFLCECILKIKNNNPF